MWSLGETEGFPGRRSLAVRVRRAALMLALALGGSSASAKEDPYAQPDPGVGTRYSRCCGEGASYSSRYCGLDVPDVVRQEPLKKEPAFSFKNAGSVSVSLIHDGAIGVSAAPDGSTFAVVPRGNGVVLKPGGEVGRSSVERVLFSPDSKHLAILNEGEVVEIVRVSDRKILGTLRSVNDVAFPDGASVAIRQGCQLRRAALSDSLSFTDVGRTTCGELLHVSNDLGSLVLASESRIRRGTFTAYTDISLVSSAHGVWRQLFATGPEVSFLGPRISKDGKSVCAIRAYVTRLSLECSVRGAPSAVLWKGGTERIHEFDPTGRYLLFEASSAIFLADLERRTARVVARAERRSFRFLGAGLRVVAHGGRAEVFDLAEGTRRTIGTPGEEWEGFAAIPGSATRFAIGRERGGGRSMYLATLPPPRSAR